MGFMRARLLLAPPWLRGHKLASLPTAGGILGNLLVRATRVKQHPKETQPRTAQERSAGQLQKHHGLIKE
jgi:hypothetical protein